MIMICHGYKLQVFVDIKNGFGGVFLDLAPITPNFEEKKHLFKE